MLQTSKILNSRNEWKKKATERATEIREHRKTQKRHLQKIVELKCQNRQLEQLVEKKKTLIIAKDQAIATQQISLQKEKTSNIIDITEAQQMRILCVLLVIEAVVSYRSVPRILELFNLRTSLELQWIPNFTSVINWTLRAGLGRLKQVQPITQSWLAIIDHSIDIGTKKALVVLRVTADALSNRGSAIELKDCECIGLTVHDKITAKTIEDDLEKIFVKAGNPIAIIKDDEYTLNKGVRLWSEKQAKLIPAISDIGHSMANALKAQFEKTDDYKNFITTVSHGAKCLRQTIFAFLMPPKLRTKGRFQSISKLGKWGEKILAVFAVKGRAKKGSELEKLRQVFPDFLKMRAFIECFAQSTQIISQVLEILKNKGLNKVTYKQCLELSKALPRNSKVKIRLQNWLKKHFEIQKQITELSLLVSSDIIESLFGDFKHIIERSPQADMNRSVLLIPALCGDQKDAVIERALNEASQLDLKSWERENIPYTMRKKRQEFFEKESHKAGKQITE